MLAGQKTVFECQLLSTAAPKLAMNQKTFKHVMATVAWPWTILFGICPKKDLQGKAIDLHRGKRLRRGVLLERNRDLECSAEFQCMVLFQSAVCICKADQKKTDSKHSFTDFRPEDSWRKTMYSNQELKARFAKHPLWKAPTVSFLSVRLDWLHTVDLGVAAYFHSSLLYSIMEDLPGTSRFWEIHNKFLVIFMFSFVCGLDSLSFPSIFMGWRALASYESTEIYPATDKQDLPSSTRRSLSTMTTWALRHKEE